MTEDELSKAAMTEKYPESNYPYDWLAWYKLRDVYRDFKAGKTSKDSAAETKKSILDARQKEIARNTEHFKAEKHLADFWYKIHAAATVYMKDPTIEHADKFVEAVYGASRLKTNREEAEQNGS